MTFQTTHGVAVEIDSKPRRRSRQLTPAQVRARRNEDWRYDHEVGRPDPVTGQLVRRPVKLIAALAQVPERTVRHGIAEARKIREFVATSV